LASEDSAYKLEEEEAGGLQFKEAKGMFIDAASMKEKLRQNMIKPEYDVCNFYKKQGFCQKVARSSIFEHTTLAVIALNAIWIAVDTEKNGAPMLLMAHPVFQIAEHFFCIYFTFEWTIRFGAFEHKRNTRRDYWFVFDSVMVFMMVGETWVMTIVLLATGSGSSNGGIGDASILRLLRLMRLSRMARMAKLLRTMPELLILIKGMITAMKSVVYTLMLLFIVIYVFAVALRQLTDGTRAGRLYFDGIFASMHTLLLDGTLMDSPGNVVKALLEDSVFLVIVFYVFVCLAALMVMNMLIGVLCEVVSAVAATEREQIAVQLVMDGFTAIISKGGLDKDGDQKISRKEFEDILEDPDTTRLLEHVNVDVYGLVDLADFIFAQDDDDEGEKHLTFHEFMDIVLKLRGTNTATVKDIVDLRKFIKNGINRLEEKLNVTRRASRQSAYAVGDADRGPSRGPAPQSVAETPLEPRALEPPPLLDVSADAGKAMPPTPRNPRRLSLPGFTDKSKIPQDLCLKALRLEGVLATAQNEISRFMEYLPDYDSVSVASSNLLVSSQESRVATPSWQMPSELRELLELRGRMSKLGEALSTGVDDLQNAQHRT